MASCRKAATGMRENTTKWQEAMQEDRQTGTLTQTRQTRQTQLRRTDGTDRQGWPSDLPLKPGRQSQRNAATRSTQRPWFWHGLDAHSSTLSWQCSPSNPAAHSHLKPPTRSTHVAPCLHFACLTGVGRRRRGMQVLASPCNGPARTQRLARINTAWHHSYTAHSSTFVPQLRPMYPGMHWHE